MNAKERAAITAYLDGCSQGIAVDDETTRQAMGVLRRLWPEYYEQLKPRPGKKADLKLHRLVMSRFTILTDPRMRDDNPLGTGPMKRPYTPSEAITKIARENRIPEDYVRELTEETRAEQKATQAKLRTDAEKRKLDTVLKGYKQLFMDDFDRFKTQTPNESAFEKYLEDAHQKAAQATAHEFGLSLTEVVRTTRSVRQEIVDEFRRRRSAYQLRVKIDY